MISSIPKWVSSLIGSAMKPNARVLTIESVSPQVKKIRFQGDISKWSFQIGYASVVRVSETEFRNYTIAYHDVDKGIFDIIFHIHDKGVGSQYVNALLPHDELFISQPRGKILYDPRVKQQFFFGDETSLGVAVAWLPLLKKANRPFHFYFELDQENKNVPELLGLENFTVFRKNGSFRNEQWINDLPLFKTNMWDTANFALVGNVKCVQTFRKVLKGKMRGHISSQGYWLEGKKGL